MSIDFDVDLQHAFESTLQSQGASDCGCGPQFAEEQPLAVGEADIAGLGAALAALESEDPLSAEVEASIAALEEQGEPLVEVAGGVEGLLGLLKANPGLKITLSM